MKFHFPYFSFNAIIALLIIFTLVFNMVHISYDYSSKENKIYKFLLTESKNITISIQ